jgi:4-amino-4-deoxy-L-arabinose transferase-like glycosyltransferase
MAVCFLHVRESHYGVNDATLTLFTTLALWGVILLHKRGRTADYLMVGVSTGLAIATKYTAAFLLIPLAIAHLSSSTVALDRLATWGFRKVTVAAVGCLLALFVGFPHLFLAPSHVLGDIYRSIFAYGQMGFEGWQLDSAGGYLFYMKALWWGLTPILCLISLGGFFLALIRHRKIDLILVSFPIVLYLFMSRQQMYFGRFLLPILPLLLVLGAEFTWTVLDIISRQLNFLWAGGRLQRAIIPR